jgi:hypothetical protein
MNAAKKAAATGNPARKMAFSSSPEALLSI